MCNGPRVECAFVSDGPGMGYDCTGDVYGCQDAPGPFDGLCGGTTISGACGVSSGDVYAFCDGGNSCYFQSSSGGCDVYRCKSPTSSPTKFPTKFPTDSPTKTPTKQPTDFPTRSPTNFPSVSPTDSPTARPTSATSAGYLNLEDTRYTDFMDWIGITFDSTGVQNSNPWQGQCLTDCEHEPTCAGFTYYGNECHYKKYAANKVDWEDWLAGGITSVSGNSVFNRLPDYLAQSLDYSGWSETADNVECGGVELTFGLTGHNPVVRVALDGDGHEDICKAFCQEETFPTQCAGFYYHNNYCIFYSEIGFTQSKSEGSVNKCYSRDALTVVPTVSPTPQPTNSPTLPTVAPTPVPTLPPNSDNCAVVDNAVNICGVGRYCEADFSYGEFEGSTGGDCEPRYQYLQNCQDWYTSDTTSPCESYYICKPYTSDSSTKKCYPPGNMWDVCKNDNDCFDGLTCETGKGPSYAVCWSATGSVAPNYQGVPRYMGYRIGDQDSCDPNAEWPRCDEDTHTCTYFANTGSICYANPTAFPTTSPTKSPTRDCHSEVYGETCGITQVAFSNSGSNSYVLGAGESEREVCWNMCLADENCNGYEFHNDISTCFFWEVAGGGAPNANVDCYTKLDTCKPTPSPTQTPTAMPTGSPISPALCHDELGAGGPDGWGNVMIEIPRTSPGVTLRDWGEIWCRQYDDCTYYYADTAQDKVVLYDDVSPSETLSGTGTTYKRTSCVPTATPTAQPTATPTAQPTEIGDTPFPSVSPSASPSTSPSASPTAAPTIATGGACTEDSFCENYQTGFYGAGFCRNSTGLCDLYFNFGDSCGNTNPDHEGCPGGLKCMSSDTAQLPKVCGSAKAAGQQCYDDADCEFTGRNDTRCVRYDPTDTFYKQCWNGNLTTLAPGGECFSPSWAPTAANFCPTGYECTATQTGYRCTQTNAPTLSPTSTPPPTTLIPTLSPTRQPTGAPTGPTPSPVGSDGDACAVDNDCGINLYCASGTCTPMLDTFASCNGNPVPCKESPPHFCGWVSYSAYDSGAARSCVQMVGDGSPCVEDGNCYGGNTCNLFDGNNPSSGYCTGTSFPTNAPTIMQPGDDCIPNPAADPCIGDSECKYSAFLGKYRCTQTASPTGVPSQTPTKSPTPTPTMDFGSALIGTDGWGTAISVGTNYAVFGKPGTGGPGGDENEVEVWKKGPSGWAYLKTFVQPDSPHAQIVAISPDDKYFAAGSADSREVTLWEQRANDPDDWGYRGAFDMGGSTGASVALNEHMFLFGDPQNSRVFYKLHGCNKAPGNTDCLGVISVHGDHTIDPPGTTIVDPTNNPTAQFGASIETEDGFIVIGAPGANEAHIYSYTNESISYVNTLDAAAVLAEYGDTVTNLGQAVGTSGGEAFVATSDGDIYTLACVATPTAAPSESPTATPTASPTATVHQYYDFCYADPSLVSDSRCSAVGIPFNGNCAAGSTCVVVPVWIHSFRFYYGKHCGIASYGETKICLPQITPSPGEMHSQCINNNDCPSDAVCTRSAAKDVNDDTPFEMIRRCRPADYTSF